jgi:DNA-binding CsgD family transcriptional regulator
MSQQVQNEASEYQDIASHKLIGDNGLGESEAADGEIVPKCPTLSDSNRDRAKANDRKSQSNHALQAGVAAGQMQNVPSVGHPRPQPAKTTALAKSSDLSEKQNRALDLLAEGMSDTEVATVINIDRRTIYRWRRRPAFRRELQRLRTELREVATDRLHLLLPAAFEVLTRQMADPANARAYKAAALVIRSVIGNSLTRTPRSERSGDGDEFDPAKELDQMLNPTRKYSELAP